MKSTALLTKDTDDLLNAKF